MAELTPQERLQPSLLDRLADDEPDKRQESREQRVLSLRQLRAGVLRDLGWLLNAGNLLSLEVLEDYPQVARSVLNYGLPDLAGQTASSLELGDLERMLRQIIWDFEPRIIRNTLKVRATLDETQMSHNTIVFEIRGELWAQPLPEELYLKTEVDLEAGTVAVYDAMGGRG